ncbi:MAG: PKD domain-containing protein [bacterium]|nr:PKD domain-containing protein [bacterium]
MIEAFHRDTIKYALGILILLAFILILGIYLLFLGRFPLGGNVNGAGLFFAGQGGDEVNQRLSTVQAEIEETLARVRALEASRAPAPVTRTPSVNITPAPAPQFLKINQFTASHTLVPSGTQVTFSYSAINTARGQSFRLLLQCPPGVIATYANGANVCRGSIAQALPIDNSGTYSVTLSNNSSESGVIIAVLLASDITDNSIFFRDSRVMTVTVMPSNNFNVVSNANASISLTSNPSGAPAPASISFTATLSDLASCVQSHWDFGDGITSENFAVCPHNVSTIRARTLFETHQYNQPGTYTSTFYAGDRRASNTIYVSAPTALFSAPSYYNPPIYTYNPPVYNYTYTQPPAYNYNYPSLPDVPTIPRNFRATASNSSGVTLSWSAPTYGNVVNYTIYRRGGNILDIPVSGSPSPCSNTGVSTCYYTVSGNLTGFTDGNVSAGNTYTYRIVAGNGYGSSDFSDSLTVNLAESNSPTVPRTFTASVNGGRIILNWSAPSSGNVANYTIYRKGGGSLQVPISTSSGACNTGDLNLCYYFVGGQTFTLTDSNLFPNTAYTYRIIASNPFGASEYSDSLTVTSGQVDPPVSTPTLNPANRVDSLGMVQLAWNSVGANFYRVYRSTNRGDALPTNDDNVSGCTVSSTNPCFLTVASGDTKIFSTNIIDNRYDATRTYFYRVKAYGANGTSNYSNEVQALPSFIAPPPSPAPTPLPPPPPAPTPAPAPDPVITSFMIDGQTTPTVPSGALMTVSYSGTNVASYKLFLSCSANVMVSDLNTGANLCRTSQNDAISINGSGTFQFAVYNLNNGDRIVSATLLALRSNGTLSNSLTRNITVHAQPGF